MKLLVTFSAALFFIAGFTSCSKNGASGFLPADDFQKQLVGKWTVTSSHIESYGKKSKSSSVEAPEYLNRVYEFNSDQTFTEKNANDNNPRNGTWRVYVNDDDQDLNTDSDEESGEKKIDYLCLHYADNATVNSGNSTWTSKYFKYNNTCEMTSQVAEGTVTLVLEKK